MTEQEKEIKRVISYIRSCRDAGIDTTITIDKSRNHFILNVLEEIQQYRVIGTVEECREAMKKNYNAGWILCSDRLPECRVGEETDVILFQMKETGTIEVGYFGRGGKYRDSYFRHYRNSTDGVDSSDVIAWQPLAEPYKPQ